MLWCLCFLLVSILTPVNAAMMVPGDMAMPEVITEAPAAHGEHALSLPQAEADGAAMPTHHPKSATDTQLTGNSCADSGSCADNTACSGICLHCSGCTFSPVSAVALTPLAQRLKLSERIQDSHSESLLPGRISPPFRPPITRR